MQRSKAHLTVNVGSRSALDCFRLACVGNAEPELAVGHRTTGQGLGGNDLSSGTTRCVGRGAIAVAERNHSALDRSGTSLVLGHQRALVGVASNGRGGSKRTGAVIGDSDRHGAGSVVVGVTGLAVVLLGHGVRKGLARVSLRKLDLMASQDVNQTNRRLCRCRGLVHVGALVQAERFGRSLVGGRHGKGELALGHGTPGEGLAELKATGRGVVELSVVRVGKASIPLLGDVGDQLALAVLGHGHLGGRDMRVIRHTGRAARVLADLVLVGSGSRVVDLAELDGGDAILHVLLAHGYGCGIGQRGALGGGDGKAELVRIRPVAAVNGLAQVKVELCVDRGHTVGVLELGGLGALQDMLGLEGAVAIVRNGSLDDVLGVTVGDALAGGSALDLAQRVGVLAGLVVLHGAHRDRAIGGVSAGSDDLSVLTLTLDELKGELVGSKLAPGQNLGRGDLVGDAGLARIRLVAVAELRLVVALQLMLCHELAPTVVGDGRLDGVGLTVVSDAVAGVARDLAQRVGVLASSSVLDGAHRDLAVGGVGAGGDDLVALDELEGELAFLEVAASQGLGRLNLISDAGALGGHRVGVLEDRLVGVLQLVLHAEGAVAVVLDDGHDSVLGGAVGNAVFGGAGLGLAQRVGVLASRGVGDGIHHDLAVGIVGAGGDHAIALDELETELAGLEVAPVQGLGRGNLVSDAGLLGARLIGVAELRLVGVLQDMLRLERAVAVVRDGGLDSELGIAVSDTAGVTLDLAQRVGVLAGLVVGDLAHRDLAVGGVLAVGDDLGALALDELEGKLAGLEVAAGQGLGRLDLVGNAGALGGHVVGVLELNLLNVLGTLQLMRSHQLALAVIADGRHDGVDGFVVSDTAVVTLDLAQRVGVLTDIGVLDGAERNVAVGVILDGLDKLRVLTLDLAQLKAELAGLEVAAGQDLGRLDLVGDAGLNRICSVGVLELALARDLFNVSLKPTRGLNRHGHFERGNVIAVGDATGVAFDLADLIGVLARLVEGDLAEVNGSLALAVRVGFVHGRVRGCRHRSVILGRRGELKLKLVRIRPAAALEHLGQAKAGLGIHRCRRHVKADLAVVAQVGIDMRRGRLGGHVVPLGIENVSRGTSVVASHTLLGGVELVDKG